MLDGDLESRIPIPLRGENWGGGEFCWLCFEKGNRFDAAVAELLSHLLSEAYHSTKKNYKIQK